MATCPTIAATGRRRIALLDTVRLISKTSCMSDVQSILNIHAAKDGALLPILHDVQAAFGYISEEHISIIAAHLNLSRAEVHGVVSFYHDFKTTAASLPVIKLCRAEACQARGVEALVAAATAQAKGRAQIEPVYCLGLCAVGPAAMVGQDVYARLDAATLANLIEAVR
jgi:formate dehydrogenase subunit gamma